MRRAKRSGVAPVRPTCGNCDRTLKIKGDLSSVACVTQLKIMPADHPGECEYYRLAVPSDPKKP
jgi:hypothetical protein